VKQVILKNHYKWEYLAIIALTGCVGTISPPISTSPNASSGPNGQHSDIYAVDYSADGKTILAQVWYPEKRASYDAMIGLYGRQFTPPLTPDIHLTQDGHYWKADQIAIRNEVELLKLWNGDRKP
jgi:hypothetical protein